jgi:membrane protease YdiL (CAAX protease family)
VSLLLDTGAPPPCGVDPMARRTRRARRWVALAEVVLCSGFPTQILLGGLLALAGVPPVADGALSAKFVLTLSLVDALLLVALIFALLRLHGESARSLFLDGRSVGREAALGALLIAPAIGLAAATAVLIRQVAPWLRNVPRNPLEDLIDTPAAAAAFAGVAVVAGGLREELQRAFVLTRFEQHLGGAAVGLVVFSAAFGAGHLLQGRDVAIVTALLGAGWGILYLWRRSVVSAVVSHAGFNVAEILRHLLGSAAGG